MTRQFRVEHTDGSTDTLPHVSSEEEYKFGEQDLGVFTTRRSAVNDVTLTEGQDEVYFVEGGVDQWGGLLKDVVRKESQTELVVDSFERLARDARPTDGDNIYENVDDTVPVNDAISDTPGLSAGTVDNVESGLSFVFSHSSQAKKMRRVEASGSGELKFNVDKTVDYADSLGADKTGTVLSPSAQNVIGDIEVERKGGSQRVTHLRMLGAGEGSAQVQTEVTVPNAPTDPEDQVWDTYRDKGLTSEDALQSLGETLIAEMNTEHVNAEVAVLGEDVALGDEFRVTVPKEQLDRDMRVVELKTVVDKEGRRHMAKLSTRQKTEASEESKRRQDVENYNVAFEGSPVTMTAGGGRQPVDGTHDYEFDFYYPAEVEYEHRVKLFVKGLQYRAYSQGAAAGGDHTHTVEVTHPSHAHDIMSAEFAHSHNIDITTDLHDHGDGTLGADSHPHTDGSLGADSHEHTDGTLGANSHGHTDGTLGADNHDHPQNITETSTQNTPHGSVVADGSSIGFPGDSNGWDQLESISISDAYELGVIHVHATSAENPIEVRARDSSSTSSSDTTGNNEDFTPRVEGTPLIGTSAADGDATGTVTLIVPEDWGFVDVDYRSTGDPNTNLSVSWMFLGEHTHDVTIGSPTGFEAPDVAGDTGDDAPGVNGDTGSDAPDVGGDTGSTAPDVDGVTTGTSAGVSGNSDETGGVRTSDAQLGNTESESSDASGDHTHPVNPGIVDTNEYPSNVDVTVNGQALGVSLGDGSGPFEQEVDLAGMLNPGQVNTVRVSSDTLGHVQAHLDIDVYRQILGNG